MVKLTLSFVMLGLGLATVASAAPVDDAEPVPVGGWDYQNPYKNAGTLGDANLNARLAKVDSEEGLRDAIYDWAPAVFGPMFKSELGLCKEKSERCDHDDFCELNTPDCRKINPGEETDQMMEFFKGSYLTIFTHGKCDHNSETKEWCSQLGLCSKYYVKDDGKCKNLDLTQESDDVGKIMNHLESSKGDAYAVQYDVPVGGYTWADHNKPKKN
ncbi:uncharacterized protein UHOD_12385 [Ustilago sp. UG-2017b]|nr:uncharacterized protein UHOD_12385 [Ustilago sp. UG-2017b]